MSKTTAAAGRASSTRAAPSRPDRAPPLDEGALCLARILGATERASQLLLPAVCLPQWQGEKLAHTPPCRAHRQRRVGGDRVGGLERRLHEVVGQHDGVHETDLPRLLGIDGTRGEQQRLGVDPGNLAGKEDRRMAGRIEAQCDLLERESGLRDRVADVGRQHEVETACARMAVDRAHQRHAELEVDQRGSGHVAERREGLVVEAFPACEPLRRRDGRLHVHPGAEDALAPSGQHGAADLRVGRHAPPGIGQAAQGGWVERVRRLGAVDGHHRHVRVGGGQLEPRAHAGCRPPQPFQCTSGVDEMRLAGLKSLPL